MGLSAAVCVGIGVGLGLWVDGALHTAPAFLLVGLALGVAAAAASVVKQIRTLPVAGPAREHARRALGPRGQRLAKVLRRTIVSAIVVGAAAVVIALLLSAALGRARARHRARRWPS